MDIKERKTDSISSSIKASIEAVARKDIADGIKHKFVQDKHRVSSYGFEIDGIYIDFSKTHISSALVEQYMLLAKDVDFEGKREKLFNGSKINTTEDRSVLHTLLRDSNNQNIDTIEEGVIDQAKDSESAFLKRYSDIQSQLDLRSEPITDIIHVGIGGSSLGTQLLFEALVDFNETTNIHFIGNIDAHQLVSVLAKCKAQSTLLIGVSKTFTTAETLQNISSIGRWFEKNGVASWMESLYAVTAKPKNAANFGVPLSNVITFPEWVGGRYSVWSSVSLSAALVLGLDKFKGFLGGAAKVDKYFYTTELDENVCFLAAMMDHYYVNFQSSGSRAIFAYDYRFRSLVDYLQQLETESNGKDRQVDGRPVDQETSPVVWGGVGTDVQHSVFQLLHQGTALIPAEFILVKTPDHELGEHHTELLANGLAQTAALLAGQDLEEVRENHSEVGLSELALQAKVFSGNRPSTTILVDQLTPEALGGLLAFYEHRTFCGGVFTNINSYDQMGVELGKRLATEVKPLLKSGLEVAKSEVIEAFDPSTIDLVRRAIS